jgi:hypothetical protein
MNEDELGQVEEEEEGGGELDEETMQLIAQLLQEGYTEDEIVEAVLAAEEGAGIDEEEDALEGAGIDEEEDPNDDRFADGGFVASEGARAAASAPAAASSEKKDNGGAGAAAIASPSIKKPDIKSKQGGDTEKKKVSDRRLKKPVNHLAVTIGRLGRFN